MIEGYEYFTSFLPSYSDDSYNRMKTFLEDISFDGEWYVSQSFGDYYLEFEESGHERDSSGDSLTVWKKK